MSWHIERYSARFGFVLTTYIKRNIPGQVPKIRTFEASLVSVVSMQKARGPREQVQKSCTGRIEASFRL